MLQALRSRDAFLFLLLGAVSFPYLYDAQLPKWFVVFGFLFHALRGWDRLDSATALLAGYAGLTLLWSPDWQAGLLSYVKLCGLAGIFLPKFKTV